MFTYKHMHVSECVCAFVHLYLVFTQWSPSKSRNWIEWNGIEYENLNDGVSVHVCVRLYVCRPYARSNNKIIIFIIPCVLRIWSVFVCVLCMWCVHIWSIVSCPSPFRKWVVNDRLYKHLMATMTMTTNVRIMLKCECTRTMQLWEPFSRWPLKLCAECEK